MARKSRKKPFAATGAAQMQDPHLETYWRENRLATAAYIRLSIENGGHDTETLQTQIQLVHSFIREQNDLSLTETYIDNGVSGTRFDRPEFVRLMDDVRHGKIQCIVVKDLSRFGRDYLETGYYLDQVFPLLNVRFIAITDQYDSEYPDSRNSITVPVKNMVNAMFAKDLSKKHEVAFQMRRENGLIGRGNAPYGYICSKEKNQLEIDPAVEPYVRLLFAWTQAGVSRPEIAKRLQILGAPTPGKHRFAKDSAWVSETVRCFQTNPAYIGTIALGKSRACLYKDIPNHKLPQSEWLVFTHAHDPYWTEEAYEAVKQRFAARKEKMVRATDHSETLRQNSPNIFQGKVYCGKCGKRLSYKRQLVSATTAMPEARYYRCDNKYHRKECVVNQRIELNALEMIVMRQVNLLIQAASNKKEIIEQALRKQDFSKKLLPIERKIGRLAERIQEMDGKLLKAYTDYAEQLLTEDEYMGIKQKFQEMRKALVMEQREQNRQLEDMRRAVERFCKWAEDLKTGGEGSEYRKKLMDELVSKIIVEGMDHITVAFDCQDVFQQELVDEYLAQIAEPGGGAI